MRFIISIWLIVLMVILLAPTFLSAQPADVTYATSATPETSVGLLGSSTVDNHLLAVTNKPTANNSFATLKTIGIG
jgi:hypothetical protein